MRLGAAAHWRGPPVSLLGRIGNYLQGDAHAICIDRPLCQTYSEAMNSRRQIVVGLGAWLLIAPLAGFAQSTRVYRIGWISLGNADTPSPYLDAFRQGLKERGYI